MIIFPKWHRKLRWAAIIYGILIFFWLGPEDNRVWPAVSVGSGAALLWAVIWLNNHFGGQSLPIRQLMSLLFILGGVAGAGASVFTALLMLFKNARHAHIFPDYPLGLMGAILERAPIWSMVGALIGLGTAFLWIGLTSDRTHTQQ